MTQPIWLDTIERLHTWLGDLMATTPELRDCSVFAIGGDGLTPEHFHWCNSEGDAVDREKATEVTIMSEQVGRAS